MAGPLMPQCVNSRGPVAFIFVPGIKAVTSSTTKPCRAVSCLSLMLSVKSEGTGASISWPKAANQRSPSPLGEPPLLNPPSLTYYNMVALG